jgi:hypothetical protein
MTAFNLFVPNPAVKARNARGGGALREIYRENAERSRHDFLRSGQTNTSEPLKLKLPGGASSDRILHLVAWSNL